MRTVLTGAAGFLGSHLADRLLAEGHEVVGIDNLITGARPNIAHLAGKPAWSFVERSVTEPLDVEGPVDFVLHFASPASPVDYQRVPIETLRAGSAGTENALALARETNARFLLASTSEIYGDPEVHPQTERYWGHVSCTGPRSCYDEAKRYAEAITMAYRRAHGVNTGIARIFNTYGPRMRVDDGRALPNFFRQALTGEPITVYGDGSQTRSFCYVSDLVEGIWRLLISDEHDPVNVGNPVEVSLLEVAREVVERTGSPSEIVFRDLPEDDPKVRCPDITRARELFGWEPVVDRREGFRRTMEDFARRLGTHPPKGPPTRP